MDYFVVRVLPTLFFIDINECTSGEHNCHQNAVCVNTEGSFTCTCNSGFVGDGKTCAGLFSYIVKEVVDYFVVRVLPTLFFIDIDECTSGDHNCHQNAVCVNTEESFTCTCNSGFVGDGQTCTGLFSVYVLLSKPFIPLIYPRASASGPASPVLAGPIFWQKGACSYNNCMCTCSSAVYCFCSCDNYGTLLA